MVGHGCQGLAEAPEEEDASCLLLGPVYRMLVGKENRTSDSFLCKLQ